MAVPSSEYGPQNDALAPTNERDGAGLVRRAGLEIAIETVEGEAEERERGGHEIWLQRLQRN